MYGVMNAKSGYGGGITSIEEEKVPGVIGERNVYGVERMVTTSMLTKDHVMYGYMDSANVPGTSWGIHIVHQYPAK